MSPFSHATHCNYQLPPSFSPHNSAIQTVAESEHTKTMSLAYGVVSHDHPGGGGGGEEAHAYELVAMSQPRPRPPRSTAASGPSSSQHQAGGLHAIPQASGLHTIPQAGPGTGMEEPAYAVIIDK